MDLLDELLKLGLRFEEVVIVKLPPEPTWPHFSKRIVDIFGEGVECLSILGGSEGVCGQRQTWVSGHNPFPDYEDCLTLSHCRELRKFEAFAPYPNCAELKLISSITSTKIEKITLAHLPALGLSLDNTYWTQLDVILVKLAEQSEHKPWLEVAFRDVNGMWNEESGLRLYLPRFAEKGSMVVLSREHEVLYSSDEVR